MQSSEARVGRPRSERARTAVLHAVDDLLLEVGYAALTMKGIAERAGVGRQTVYRWWSTKAEVLYEASIIDAEQELAVPLTGRVHDDLVTYLEALATFLADSPAGVAYRALLGEAQHDPAVATLLAHRDLLGDTARAVVEQARAETDHPAPVEVATTLLVGPLVWQALSGRDPRALDPGELADRFRGALAARPTQPTRSSRRSPARAAGGAD